MRTVVRGALRHETLGAAQAGFGPDPLYVIIVGLGAGKVAQDKGRLHRVREGSLLGNPALGIEILPVGAAPQQLVREARHVQPGQQKPLRKQVGSSIKLCL